MERFEKFADRIHAGAVLARRLDYLRDASNLVVLGIPRGGVVVAKSVADYLDVPLDILVTHKIGAPQSPEFAIGAVNSDGRMVYFPDVLDEEGITLEALRAQARGLVETIRLQESELRQGRGLVELAGRSAVLVDDGIATGATIKAGVLYLKEHQAAQVIVATPVASQSAIEALESMVDQLVVAYRPPFMFSVGFYYQDFAQVETEVVRRILACSN